MLLKNPFCSAKRVVFHFRELYMNFPQRVWSAASPSPCRPHNSSSPKSNNSSLFNPHHNYILLSPQQSIYAAKIPILLQNPTHFFNEKICAYFSHTIPLQRHASSRSTDALVTEKIMHHSSIKTAIKKVKRGVVVPFFQLEVFFSYWENVHRKNKFQLCSRSRHKNIY